jgi:polyisoprenoid-binding protein YceI
MTLNLRLGPMGVGFLAVSLFAGTSSGSPKTMTPTQQGSKTSVRQRPLPGQYQIDSAHTFAFFGARHHVVGLVRGRFDNVEGTFTAAKDPAACAIDVSIDVASISTQVPERDEDLRSPEYFDTKKCPTMTYKGHGIRPGHGATWIMDGLLTMHGVTKVVPLTFTFNGVMDTIQPGKPIRVAIHGSAAVKRAEFGLGKRDNLDELGTLNSPDVQIDIDVEAESKVPAP